MLAPALRKAAVLISALDRDSADALLEQMPEDHAAQVRSAIMELPEVSQEEQDQVLREFFSGNAGSPSASNSNSTFPSADEPGVELELGAASRMAATQPSIHTNHYGPKAGITQIHTNTPAVPLVESPLEETTASGGSHAQNDAAPMFEYLQKATPATLSRLLKTEHPQVTAVVISHLPAEKAAAIIETLDEQLQIDVLHRVAAIGEADPDAMRQLDSELGAILRKLDPALQLHDSGVQAVSAILKATSQRKQILQRLHTQNSPLTTRVGGKELANGELAAPSRPRTTGPINPVLPLPAQDSAQDSARSTERLSTASADERTEQLKSPVPLPELSFDDVTRLPDADLAILLRTASPQVVLLSLLGAEPAFVNRLMRQLPPADARRFRERFNQTTPLSLADIDEAQRRLARLAAELIVAGRIQKTRTQFAAAA